MSALSRRQILSKLHLTFHYPFNAPHRQQTSPSKLALSSTTTAATTTDIQLCFLNKNVIEHASKRWICNFILVCKIFFLLSYRWLPALADPNSKKWRCLRRCPSAMVALMLRCAAKYIKFFSNNARIILNHSCVFVCQVYVVVSSKMVRRVNCNFF